MVENSKAYDTGRQLGKLLRKGKESSDKTVAATKKVSSAIATQSSVLMTFVKEVRDTARNDAGDRAEALALRKKEAKKSENEKNSEGGRFGKLIDYFKKDAKESRTEFGGRLFSFFGKVALGIGAIVLFFKNWKGVIKPFIKGFVDTLFPKLDERRKELYKKIDERFTKIFGKDIKTTLKDMKKNVFTMKDAIVKIFDSLRNFFGLNKVEKPEGMLDRDFYNTLTPGKFASATEVFGDDVKFDFANRYAAAMSPEGNKEEEERLLKLEEKKDRDARLAIAKANFGLSLPDIGFGVNSHREHQKALKDAEETLNESTLLSQHRNKLFKNFIDNESKELRKQYLEENVFNKMKPDQRDFRTNQEVNYEKNFAGMVDNMQNFGYGFDFATKVTTLGALGAIFAPTGFNKVKANIGLEMAKVIKAGPGFKAPGEGVGTERLNRNAFSANNLGNSIYEQQEIFSQTSSVTRGLESSRERRIREDERARRLTPTYGPDVRALGSGLPTNIITDSSVTDNSSRVEMVSKILYSKNDEYEDIP